MNIVIEGPDNAGKSTLASYIAQAIGWEIVSSEGPEKYPGEVNARILRYLGYDRTIFDRHPVVSQSIYNQTRKNGTPPNPDLSLSLYASRPFIIYCRGRDLKGHIEKSHDSPEHIEAVKQNHSYICEAYDAWALANANIVYQIGDSIDQVIRQVSGVVSGFDPVRDIEEFHRKFGLEYKGVPRTLTGDLGEFRKRFMDEELTEYDIHHRAAADELTRAPKHRDQAEYTHRLEEQLDALVDLTYVVLGTAHLQGFDFKEAWKRVHQANMSKVRATSSGQSKRGSTFDVVKPDGWQPPSHADLVEDNDIGHSYEELA